MVMVGGYPGEIGAWLDLDHTSGQDLISYPVTPRYGMFIKRIVF